MRYEKLHMAVLFATEYHMGQDRKYSEVPYISHPINVMEIVRTVSSDEAMLVAAVLHDVVEDTECTQSDISAKFGETVSELVEWLTDVSVPDDGNRNERKQIDRQHTAAAPADAKTIKLADLIHNTGSIVNCDPDFARIYMKEKALLLDVLKDGDPALWNRAHKLLVDYQESLLQEALR